MNFYAAWKKLHAVEGDWSNHPSDRGGKTMYGITERVARAAGYDGPMPELPLAMAMDIAKTQYWDVLRCDDICAHSFPIAYELLDTGYNMGTGTAGRFFQRALNVFNRTQADYRDIVADGVIGHLTIAAFRAFMHKRGTLGEIVMLRALNSMQGARYIEIAEKDSSQEAFTFGWFSHRVVI